VDAVDRQDDKKTVLLVDDEPLVSRALSRLLSREPAFNLTTTHTSFEALDCIAESPPDLILLDIQLRSDDVGGIECLRQIRAAGYQGTVCMFTGDPSPEMLLTALIAEADDYIVKPIKGFDLIDEIRQLLDLGRSQVQQNSGFYSVLEPVYLRSRGVTKNQLQLLTEYLSAGFPREKTLAEQVGKSENAIWKQFHQIRDLLGLETNAQLAHILTILHGYNKSKRNKASSQAVKSNLGEEE
jgi:DNA-binding NarL/FixJ family response regulator